MWLCVFGVAARSVTHDLVNSSRSFHTASGCQSRSIAGLDANSPPGSDRRTSLSRVSFQMEPSIRPMQMLAAYTAVRSLTPLFGQVLLVVGEERQARIIEAASLGKSRLLAHGCHPPAQQHAAIAGTLSVRLRTPDSARRLEAGG